MGLNLLEWIVWKNKRRVSDDGGCIGTEFLVRIRAHCINLFLTHFPRAEAEQRCHMWGRIWHTDYSTLHRAPDSNTQAQVNAEAWIKSTFRQGCLTFLLEIALKRQLWSNIMLSLSTNVAGAFLIDLHFRPVYELCYYRLLNIL